MKSLLELLETEKAYVSDIRFYTEKLGEIGANVSEDYERKLLEDISESDRKLKEVREEIRLHLSDFIGIR